MLVLLLAVPLSAATDVLMVADEIPAMETLAKQLKDRIGLTSTVVQQTEIPADLSTYSTLMVYIHRDINEPAEKAFIDYAKKGGRLILLHHSISSGKRPNKYWFPFLGITLPPGDIAAGGYKYYDPADFDIVNLAPGNFITTNKVKYPATIAYQGKELSAFHLHDTEVYLNHVFIGPRTLLLGIKYNDTNTGKLFEQPTAGWYMTAGKGLVFYFMAGHNARDFDDPVYAQIIANAVKFQP